MFKRVFELCFWVMFMKLAEINNTEVQKFQRLEKAKKAFSRWHLPEIVSLSGRRHHFAWCLLHKGSGASLFFPKAEDGRYLAGLFSHRGLRFSQKRLQPQCDSVGNSTRDGRTFSNSETVSWMKHFLSNTASTTYSHSVLEHINTTTALLDIHKEPFDFETTGNPVNKYVLTRRLRRHTF